MKHTYGPDIGEDGEIWQKEMVEKPKQWWLSEDGGDDIKVIEYSAYQKAIEVLRLISDMHQIEDWKRQVQNVLKELGEIE